MDPAIISLVADTLKILVPVGTLLLGFSMSQWVVERDRKRRLRGSFGLIYKELITCREHAAGMVAANIMSPLGRLPTAAYDAHFGIIVTESDLSADELHKIQLAYESVQTLNRGLDLAADAASVHDGTRLAEEWNRNKLKANKFADANYFVGAALAVLEKRLGIHTLGVAATQDSER